MIDLTGIGGADSNANAGILSIIPPIVAIVLALITKEVVFSLILGILSGTVIYSLLMGYGPAGVLASTTQLMAEKLAENTSMILFLCLLGIVVAVINKAGGSKAYGDWASAKLSTKRSAGLATSALGVIIFIDDYFNCLTVGTVMRPVTDKLKMSREKLAYIIDATAAPVCIIAPISSWAAAVISYFPASSGNGMTAFLESIPFNFYAMLTIFMVFYMSIKKNADYGPMALAEKRCVEEGFFNTANEGRAEEEFEKISGKKGRVIDLALPVIVLVVFSVISMLYVGGMWTPGSAGYMNLFTAFGETDAGSALALSAFASLIFIFIYFMLRRTLNFKEFFSCINTGINNMVPACVILTLAWTISGVCRDLLKTGSFVADFVQQSGIPVHIIPACIFLIACLLSFATGTAWGTFGILIPIVIAICEVATPELVIVSLSATLAGSVFGDHASPISDTTILASAGAECNHLAHVGTQAPYAVTVAVCCFIGYLIAGLTRSVLGHTLSLILSLGIGLVLLIILLQILPKVWNTDSMKTAKERN